MAPRIKTSERIVQNSLELFNQQGERSVSTNHIAAHMEISPGNLYYHFPNKQAIIAVLFSEYESLVDSFLRPPQGRAATVEDKRYYLQELLAAMWRYRFLHRDLEHLLDSDPELAARAVIMSGAYEENWKKHPGLQNSFGHWQNKLPLYNMRMQNLSAAVIRPQLPEVARRVAQGRSNHDYVADRLNSSAWLTVPPALAPEDRAPDSIQFNLTGFETDAQALAFQQAAKARGVAVQIFGLSAGNARAFWNWQFLGDPPDLPMTRAMLMRACDTRLPARLTRPELDFIAEALLAAAEDVKG